MRRSGWALKLLFTICLVTLAGLLGYKAYLNLFKESLRFAHTEQVSAIESRLDDRQAYTFAVVGNINNSVGIFQRQMVPMLNDAGVDFVVSAGNAVRSNGEAKYQALRGALRKLEVPYLLTFGEEENGAFGSYRFYEHFGPYFYSFEAGDALFLFLDSTGHTSLAWQLRWLERELRTSKAEHTFAFLGHPPLQINEELLFGGDEGDYLSRPGFRDQLTTLLQRHGVDAVFSANLPVFARQEHKGTTFVTTGGAGGLVLNTEASYYHYVRVAVSPEGVTIEPVPLDIGQHPVLAALEGFWLTFHSFVYVGYRNFFLLLSALGVVAIWLYRLIFRERDYYPDFSVDPTPYRGERLRVAMFTNNYLPFVGGVPISIDRLRRGLRSIGHSVRIVAPRYEEGTDHEPELIRAPSLLAFGQRREFRLANLLALRIRRGVRAFQPQVVHVHHPFWLGSLGLWLARRWRLPLVYTYHTRLEHYAHYVPLPGPLFRNLISHALVRRFANRCDAVIVPTQSAEEYLRVVGVTTPIFVQPTGIDYARFHGVNAEAVERLRAELGLAGERVLISVSRLTREKNLDFLIDAVYRLAQRCQQPFRVLIVGDGPERGRLQARIDALGLGERITLVGTVAPETVPLYYTLSDAFVFASKSETQGMVLLEAMAARLPVVAVRSSGVDDVIRDGVDGFKTPESPQAWAQRAAELVDDDARRKEMAHAAETRARGFDLEPVAREVAEVYAYVRAARAQAHETGSERDAAS
ncbi:MAG: glycosyltransferase [Halorhodospira sp.]